MTKKIIVSFLSVLFLIACDTKLIEPQEISFDNEYLPLTNFELTYDVFEITYNTLGSDTLHYTQKEKTIEYKKVGNQESNTFLVTQTGINKPLNKSFVAKYINNNQEIILENSKSELLLTLPLSRVILLI